MPVSNTLDDGVSEIIESPVPKLHPVLLVGIFCSMVIEIVGVYVIRQSKRTPRTARFLISGIIVFKLSGHIIFIIAKFLLKSEHVIRGFLHIVTSFVVLVIVTHALMSLERFVVFSAYRMHFRITGSSRARNSVIIFWLSLWLLNTFIRFTFCSGNVKGIWKCTWAIQWGYFMLFSIVVIVSYGCFAKILLLIRSKNAKSKVKMKVKTTTLIFVYLISISGNIVLFLLELSMLVDATQLSLIAIIVSVVTSLLDRILYIYWFRECRMELLKLVACCIPRLKPHVEKMRIEIFDVVTYIHKDKTTIPVSYSNNNQNISVH